MEAVLQTLLNEVKAIGSRLTSLESKHGQPVKSASSTTSTTAFDPVPETIDDYICTTSEHATAALRAIIHQPGLHAVGLKSLRLD